MARDECIAPEFRGGISPASLQTALATVGRCADAMVYIGETGNRAARSAMRNGADERTARPEVMPDHAAQAP